MQAAGEVALDQCCDSCGACMQAAGEVADVVLLRDCPTQVRAPLLTNPPFLHGRRLQGRIRLRIQDRLPTNCSGLARRVAGRVLPGAPAALIGKRQPRDQHACLQVVEAFGVSRATLRKIRENLVWAFGYNLVGVPVAAGVLLPSFGIMLSPSISGALMGMSSLAVMGNSLLLKREGGRPSLISSGSGGSPKGPATSAPVAKSA